MAQIITTLGPKRYADLGMILPHEHIFVDLRTWDTSGYAQAETEEVLTERFLPKLRAAGVDEATIHQLTRTNPYPAFAC